MLKECFKCHKMLEANNFYKHSKMADGLFGKCKECTKKDVKNRYDNNFEKIQVYEKIRSRSIKRKEMVGIYNKNRKLKNPIREKARYLTSNAIRDGRIKKEPCCECGNKKAQAHHGDYSKPLEITWLCFTCHRKRHGQLKKR
jgi:hypothetical protein